MEPCEAGSASARGFGQGTSWSQEAGSARTSKNNFWAGYELVPRRQDKLVPQKNYSQVEIDDKNNFFVKPKWVVRGVKFVRAGSAHAAGEIIQELTP